MNSAGRTPHRVSIVIPVYQGEHTLGPLMEEIALLAVPTLTKDSHEFQVTEVLLVHDKGPDRSDVVIRQLAAAHDFIRPVWLSRNFGQHPATLAGMASSSGDWIVTMDEDGQHDPSDIGGFLDVALSQGSQLVYADPVNSPPHNMLRNGTSRLAKWVFSTFLTGNSDGVFQSYRLVLGEIGRSVAAYAGSGVYLDVAMGWVAGPTASCPVRLRDEGARRSGYSTRALLSHFWHLVLSSGTRALRMVSALGALFALGGISYAIYLLVVRVTTDAVPQGWTSTMVVVLVSTGAILFSLGVIAEYVGVAVSMAMGKPLYLIVGDPKDGPLGRRGHKGLGTS
ncbi:MAG: glycosyltransferase [Phycicoccus sp.]|nr:glycosyltransferase [Phycicoccus sp.]NMM34328.1 glycosyltransferase [Phycicoccus sp.]